MIAAFLWREQTLEYEDEVEGADVKAMLKDLYGDNYLLTHPKLSMYVCKQEAVNSQSVTHSVYSFIYSFIYLRLIQFDSIESWRAANNLIGCLILLFVFSNSVQKKLASLNDVSINLEQFKEFCQSHELLAPAFQTQKHLCRIILGEKFWAQAMKKRKALEAEFVFKKEFKLDHEMLEK
jgi:hypothetical protein